MKWKLALCLGFFAFASCNQSTKTDNQDGIQISAGVIASMQNIDAVVSNYLVASPQLTKTLKNPKYSIVGGTLPAGLQLSSTGQVFGTPTNVFSRQKFTLKVTSNSGNGSIDFNIRISKLEYDDISIKSGDSMPATALPKGSPGTGFDFKLLSTPKWLTIDLKSGLLKGVPTDLDAGDSTVYISVVPNTPNTVGGGSIKAKLHVDRKNPLHFKQISPYVHGTCGLLDTDQPYCFGVPYSSAGNSGFGLPSGLKFTQVVTGHYWLGSLGLTDNGKVYYWWTQGLSVESGEVPLPAGTKAISIGNMLESRCILADSGKTYCSDSARLDPMTEISSTVILQQFSVGDEHGCGLTNVGDAYCWGVNDSGQLGDGNNTDNRSSMVTVKMPTMTKFNKISAGKNFSGAGGESSCALDTLGNAYCWGNNHYGQLGNGTNTDSNTPVAINMPVMTKFADISVGNSFVCALDTLGNAYCWGNNYYGQLGNGTNIDSNVSIAIKMPIMTKFTKISAGDGEVCALDIVGAAYCWGRNNFVQLGDGTKINSNIPVKVQ